jgi:hypothetical protein
MMKIIIIIINVYGGLSGRSVGGEKGKKIILKGEESQVAA